MEMKRNILVAAILSGLISTAFAGDAARAAAEKVIEMKDGSTLYIFKDKKMSMEDQYGRATRMKPGHAMETKDGQQLMMVGDEVARLDWLLKEGHTDN
jgi:predicted lipoprotein with Yx(FWY)xxD motif